jgi:transposase
MRSDLIAMTPREIHRLGIVQQLLAGSMKQAQAAKILGVGVRQVKRLVSAYRRGGATAVVSKARGRTGNRRRDPDELARAVRLVVDLYHDFGPTLASETLLERHGLRVDRETLRKLLIEAGVWKRKRRSRAYHPPRERRSCFGELIQIDGSPHAWFEDRGPRCTLLVFIDDATSQLVALRFAKAESTAAYFEVAHRYFSTFGLPQAFYSDRHGIFRINHPGAGKIDLTQFGAAMEALDIELICAKSPQAKGRVERVNRTLQDRLVKALRLANIDSLEAGNAFLESYRERHNARFAEAPRDVIDLHRPITSETNLALLLVRRTQRKVTKDLTFSFASAIYKIIESKRREVFPHAIIEILTLADGGIAVERHGRQLAFELVRERKALAPILDAKELAERAPRKGHTPPVDHPWRHRGQFQLLALAAPKGDIPNLQGGDIIEVR